MKLGYTCKSTSYTGELNEISEYNENVCLGLYMTLDESEAKSILQIRKKQDPYEIGRTIVRAQQLIGLITDQKDLATDILKRNQYYFGNNPTETVKVDKVEVPVRTAVSELESSFLEKSQAKNLLPILVKLMRSSYSLVEAETLWDNLVPNIITYSDVVHRYCTKEIVTTPAIGRKPAITRKKVPTKPKANNLFLKPELDFLNKVSAGIFEPTPFERLEHSAWAEHIFAAGGLAGVKTTVQSIYNKRADFLTRLAGLSTRRLRAYRKTDPSRITAKKATIQASDLEEVILTRASPEREFAKELSILDPSGQLFIGQFYAGPTRMAASSELSEDELELMLTISIVEANFYSELKIKRLSVEQAQRDYLNEIAVYRQRRQELVQLTRTKLVPGRLPRVPGVFEFDLGEALGRAPIKGQNKKGKKPQRVPVPHDQNKMDPTTLGRRTEAKEIKRMAAETFKPLKDVLEELSDEDKPPVYKGTRELVSSIHPGGQSTSTLPPPAERNFPALPALPEGATMITPPRGFLANLRGNNRG
jgi:hypothetical protein